MDEMNEAPRVGSRKAKRAAEFGEDNTRFLWFPYLPMDDYTVVMAEGGTGKTILTCGIAAYVSTGRALPGDVFDGDAGDVLIISAEDSGEILKKRLRLSGADLERVYILDRSDSIGMNFSTGYDEFEETVKAYSPALVILDPWHAFLGADVDINRVNAIRPVFQKLSNLAKVCGCALILISHVNKRAQGENANNAATGSSDFINAARSAIRVIFDEEDEDCRILVHTKTNYARYGDSVRYRIEDGGVKWEGFSEITKATLEAAARQRSTPLEVLEGSKKKAVANDVLIKALKDSAPPYAPARFTYEEFKQKHGALIFGGSQPKRALDSVREQLMEDGYFLKPCNVKRDNKPQKGFMIQQVDTRTAEQSKMF